MVNQRQNLVARMFRSITSSQQTMVLRSQVRSHLELNGFEQLEERQMLSGTGEELLGSGGTSMDGLMSNWASYTDGSVSQLYGYGTTFDRISLPDYWAQLPDGFSYDQVDLMQFVPLTGSGETGVIRTYDESPIDNHEGYFTVVLTELRISNFEVSVSGNHSSGNYQYNEHIEADLVRLTLETQTPTAITTEFLTSGMPTLASYIRQSSHLNYQFQLNALDGINTYFRQYASEASTHEFQWTTELIQPEFDTTSLEGSFVHTLDGSMSMFGKIETNVSVSTEATRADGSDLHFVLQGHGTQQTQSPEGLRIEIERTESLASGPVTDGELQDGRTKEDSKTFTQGDVGYYTFKETSGEIVQTFSNSIDIPIAHVSRLDGSLPVLVGTVEKTIAQDSTSSMDMTVRIFALEAEKGVVPAELGAEQPEDSGGGMTLYKAAGEGELAEGDVTWHLGSFYNKLVDKSKTTTDGSSRESLSYFGDGTQLATRSSNKGDATNPHYSTKTHTFVDQTIDNEAYSHYWSDRIDTSTGTLALRSTFRSKDLNSSSDVVSGTQTTYEIESLSVSENQTGHSVLTESDAIGSVATKGQDKTTHSVESKDIISRYRQEHASLSLTGNESDATDPQLVFIKKTANLRFENTDDRTIVHDDKSSLEFEFHLGSGITLHDTSVVDLTTTAMTGTKDNDIHSVDDDVDGDLYLRENHETTFEELSSDAPGKIRIVNNLHIQLGIAASDASADDDADTSTETDGNLDPSTSLTSYEVLLRTGEVTREVNTTTKSRFDLAKNRGNSKFRKKYIKDGNYAFENRDVIWDRNGSITNKVDLTEKTTYGYATDTTPVPEDLEQNTVKFDLNHASKKGEITENQTITALSTVNSEAWVTEFDPATFSAESTPWHDPRKSAITGTQLFQISFDTRNDKTVQTIDQEQNKHLTYTLLQKTDAAESDGSDSGDNSSEAPSVDADRYDVSVTGISFERINDLTATDTTNRYVVNAFGQQTVTVLPSSWFTNLLNGGSISEAQRTEIDRQTTYEWKKSIEDAPGRSEISVRKTITTTYTQGYAEIVQRAILGQPIFQKVVREQLDGEKKESTFSFIGLYEEGHGYKFSKVTTTESLPDTPYLDSRSGQQIALPDNEIVYRRRSDLIVDDTTTDGQIPDYSSNYSTIGRIQHLQFVDVRQNFTSTSRSNVDWVRSDNGQELDSFHDYRRTTYYNKKISRLAESTITFDYKSDGSMSRVNYSKGDDHAEWRMETFGTGYSSQNNGEMRTIRESTSEGSDESGTVVIQPDVVTYTLASSGSGYYHREGEYVDTHLTESWNGQVVFALGQATGWITITTTESSIPKQYSNNSYGGNPVVTKLQGDFYVDHLKTFNYHITTSDPGYVTLSEQIWNQSVGKFQIGMGLLEFVVGAVSTPLTGPVGLTMTAMAADNIAAGLIAVATGRETRTIVSTLASEGAQWYLQAFVADEDFVLTAEEAEGIGTLGEVIAGFGLDGIGAAFRVGKQLSLARKIFTESANACDKISKLGRARESWRLAAEVAGGKRTLANAAEEIVKNNCFVGDTLVYWYRPHVKPELYSATMAGVPGTSRWMIAGLGIGLVLAAVVPRSTQTRKTQRQQRREMAGYAPRKCVLI